MGFYQDFIANRQMRSDIAKAYTSRKNAWAKTLTTNQHGLTVNANGSLKYDDYKALTDDVVMAREHANVGILYRTLVGAGLVRPVDIGKTLIDYHDMNDNGGAFVSMDASNRQNGETDYNQKVVPLPIIHKDFVIPWRQEGFSYKQSDGVQQTIFDIVEARDLMLLNGASNINVNGTTLTGFTNTSGVLTDTISDWALTATTGATIRSEAVTLVRQLLTDAKVGAANSCAMFVAPDVWGHLEDQYSTSYEAGSILRNLQTIAALRSVEMLPGLIDGAVLIVELMPRTVDLAVATDVIAMPWQISAMVEDGRFTCLASCTPRIKLDRNSKTGIMYATK